jgi:drug/metabolite transporter (DMT)-like permease
VAEASGTDGRPTIAESAVRAILINVTGILLLDVMGVIIKFLSANYSAAELSAYRNLFGMVPSVIVLWMSANWHARGRRLWLRQWRLAWLRGGFVTVAQFMFYLSLARLEFATATTISFSMSLFITAFAVPLLGERVGVVRWLAVVIGFVGVVMVMGLGSDAFSLDALLPLGAAMFYALTSVTARMIDSDVPTPLVNLYSNLAAAAGAILLTLSSGGFSPITSAGDLGWIVAMGAIGGSGVLFLIVSFRMTEPSNLAPFNYFGIPFAVVLGWVFFGEIPFDRLFPGVILIIAGGLIIVWREQRLRRQRRAVAPRPH